MFFRKKQKESSQNIKIIPTAPMVNNNDSVNKYVDIIERVSKYPSIYNVALAGSYGTGKSTIIKTFLEKGNNNKKALIISIGSFLKPDLKNSNEKDTKTDIQEEKEQDQDEEKIQNKNEKKKSHNEFNNGILNMTEVEIVDKIEKGILKQIVYKNTQDDLPRSNIKRLKNEKKDIIDKITLFYIVCCFLIFLFVKFFCYENNAIFLHWLPELNIPAGLSSFVSSIYNYLVYGVLLLLIFAIGYKIYSLICSLSHIIQIRKLKTSNYELDFANETDLTFTKQLYEIIYFFTKNKYEIVFFEDIDRFPEDITVKVMEELKEINSIINSIQPKKKKVVFIYSFKDDIFQKMEDKSKFYDYTISVMPIVTKYNSFMMLKEKLKDAKIQNIGNELLSITAKYIIDVRTIINIVNDYQIFNGILETNNYDRLFAMMVYKNYDIKDYGKIMSSENEIEKILKQFNNQKNRFLEENREKLNNCRKEIEEIKIKTAESEKNYKEAFINSIAQKYGFPTTIEVGDKRCSVEDFLKEEFDMDNFFINQVNIYCDLYLEELEIFGDYGSKNEFKEGYLKLSDDLKEKYDELEKYEFEEDAICNYKKDNYKFLDNDNKLLHKLVMYGFIRDDYIDYVTLPIDNSRLTSTESKFIFYVQHGQYQPDIHLNNIDEVIGYLDDSDFEHFNILNFDLIIHMIKKQESYGVQLQKIIHKFEILKNERIDFLYQFSINNQFYFEKFLQLIIDDDIDLWSLFLKSKYSNVKNYKIIFASSLLKCNNFIECLTSNDQLINFINDELINRIDFNFYLKENTNIKDNFIKLKIRLTDISKIYNENIMFIYENNLYKFNYINFEKLFGKKPNSINDMKYKEYIDTKYFIDYMIKSFSTFYIEYYKENIDFKIDDSNIVLDILERDDLSKDSMKELYIRETFKIKPANIKNGLYEFGLKYNHIVVSWDNIIYLTNYINNKILLIDFIVENSKVLFTENYIPKIRMLDHGLKKEIIRSLIKKFDEDSLDIILATLDEEKIKYNLKEIRKQDWRYVIVNNLVSFNIANFRLIKTFLENKYVDIYIENWYLDSGNIKKMYSKVVQDESCVESFLKCKFLSENEKMDLIVKLSPKLNDEELEKNFRIVFKNNIRYEIKNTKSIYEKTIKRLMPILKIITLDKKNIIFQLEPTIKNNMLNSII